MYGNIIDLQCLRPLTELQSHESPMPYVAYVREKERVNQ